MDNRVHELLMAAKEEHHQQLKEVQQQHEAAAAVASTELEVLKLQVRDQQHQVCGDSWAL
jgi:hypothetical protein